MQPHSLIGLLPRSARALLKSARFHYRNRGFSPYVSEHERDGEFFRFYVGDRIGELWYKGGWDQAEIGYLREHLVRPGDVVFECGAHHGELTIHLSRWVGEQGKVVAFEPVPRNRACVQKQIELNDLKNVTLVHAAVGRERGRARITDDSNAEVAGKRGPGIEVEMVRLDDYVEMKPTMLKIDVEGYEAELLKGAREVMKLRPRISLEMHPQSFDLYGTSVEEVLALVNAESYHWKMHYSDAREISDYEGQKIDRRMHLFGIPKAGGLASG